MLISVPINPNLYLSLRTITSNLFRTFFYPQLFLTTRQLHENSSTFYLPWRSPAQGDFPGKNADATYHRPIGAELFQPCASSIAYCGFRKPRQRRWRVGWWGYRFVTKGADGSNYEARARAGDDNDDRKWRRGENVGRGRWSAPGVGFCGFPRKCWYLFFFRLASGIVISVEFAILKK